MEFNPLETTPQAPLEKSEEELLQEQRAEAQHKIEEMKARASEFYDTGLYELLSDVAGKMANENLTQLYLKSIGISYAKALENLKKKDSFDKNQLKPLRQELYTIETQLAQIAGAKRQAEKEEQEKQLQEAFEAEKSDIETKLYEALDAIHSQIPKEASEVGMTTEAAIATYLPNLVQKTKLIEYFIGRMSDVDTAYQLSLFKKEVESYRIFT